jgi:hypothetical protein
MGMRWARLIGITCLAVGAMVVAATLLAPPHPQPGKNADISVAKGVTDKKPH